MAQLILAAAGSAIGSLAGTGVLAFGMTGAQLGWMAGGLLGSAFAPAQKQQGPRLGDLTVTGSSYGSVIPYVEGHPRISGQVIWASNKREIATTTRHGKGGGKTKVTTYTYEVDLLLLLTDVEIEGVLRVWSQGDMVFSQSDTATYETLVASIYTSRWSRLTVYGGDAAQLPDPDYEAAVGAGCPAYRGRGTVFIKSLQLGQSGQIPNLTFEVVRKADLTNATLYHTVEALSGEITGIPGGDYSGIIDTSVYKFGSASTKGYTDSLLYPTIPIAQARGRRNIIYTKDFTLAIWVYLGARPLAGRFHNLATVGPFNTLRVDSDGRVYIRPYDSSSPDYGAFNGTNLSGKISRNPQVIPLSTWTHVVMQRVGNTWTTMVSGNHHVHKFWSDYTVSDLPLSSGDDLEPGSESLDPSTGKLFGDMSVVFSDNWDSIWAQQALPTPVYPLFDKPVALGALAGSSSGVGPGYFGIKRDPEYLDTTGTASGNRADNMILYLEALYPLGLDYVMPTLPDPVDSSAVAVYNFDQINVLASDDPTLQEVVERLCAVAGLQPSQVDASPLAAVTTKVHGMTISQVSTVRSTLEALMGAYFFEAVVSDKIKFVPRAGASVQSIAYADLGWAVENKPDEDRLPLTTKNELELPAQLAITYQSSDGDWLTDTQYSDRVFTGQESLSTVQLPLGFTASEAKVIADARLTDMYVGLTTAQFSVSIAHAKLQPTDVVTVQGRNGESYRFRLMRKVDGRGVLQFDAVLDDATVFTQAGLTSGGVDSQTTVAATPSTAMELLDIPLLRDAEDDPGFYVAVHSPAASWPGAEVYGSIDNISFGREAVMGSRCVYGVCSTTLGDWASPGLFDEYNSVTVEIEYDSLDSWTTDDLLRSTSLNAALIGDEILQFRSAQLIAPKTYVLTGLLRGRRGTEQHIGTHGASERFILLATGGFAYLPLALSDLGRQRYYKSPSAGQSLSAIMAKSITPFGVPLKPFSPVHAAANRNSTDTVITWFRRTRLATRVGGPLPQAIPLGEGSERYEVEIYASGAFATVKRTLSSTTPTVTYTSANQVTDFGSNQTVLYVRIYQLSNEVGRGFPLEATI